MSDRFSEAIRILQDELGFSALSIWAPGDDEDSEVLALLLAKDDDAMIAAAVDLVAGNKGASWKCSSASVAHE